MSLDMLGTASLDGYFTQLNPAWERTVGWTAEELMAEPFITFVHPDDVESTLEQSRLLGTVSGTELRAFENRYRARSGEYLWIKWDVVSDASALYFVARDVTALRESEESLRLLADKLTDHTVALEAVNQELESFSYSVSHDLRAPLRAIDGFTASLERDYADKFDDAGQNMLARVRRATAKMSTLIEALLMLSRLSRCQLIRTSLDISTLAKEIEEELRESDPDRVVEFVIEDGLCAVADGVLARTALTNLLGNAWKFSGQRKHGRIEFASAGGRSFVVRDNGLGFDMTYVDKLFVPFARLHRDDEVAGTGIGLATVSRIVNRHGGQLRGEGTVGEGADFYFDFGDETLPG
jgi:PAS domain S-box-containing protein